MGLIKYTSLILLALFVDGLQAAISWGLAVIAAFPGTAGGAALGCITGSFAGQIGCWLGGTTLAVFGSVANLAAPVTIPIGFALGIATAMCISMVLGWGFLVPLMLFSGIRPKRKLAWGLGEMVPGINNVPFWTLTTVLSVVADARSGRHKHATDTSASVAANDDTSQAVPDVPTFRPNVNDDVRPPQANENQQYARAA